MKRTFKITLSLLIAFLGLLLVNKENGHFDIQYFNVPDDSFRIKFINESKRDVKSIYIRGEKIRKLKIGESYIYTQKQSGEGTYQFEIEFETGEKLQITERYVEAGYYLTERIKNNRVETEY